MSVSFEQRNEKNRFDVLSANNILTKRQYLKIESNLFIENYYI